MIAFLAPPDEHDHSMAAALRLQRWRFDQAWLLMRILYFVLFLRALIFVGNSWALWIEVEQLRPIWPTRWIPQDHIAFAVTLIDLLLIGSTLLGVFRPDWRWLRVVICLAFLEFAAFANSFGKMNHGFHMWIAILAMFALLPSGRAEVLRASISQRQRFLLVFRTTQILILTFYTLSGLIKLGHAVWQLGLGQVSALHPQALAHHVAFRLNQTNSQSMLGPLFIDYPLLGWPLYLLTLYLETFALVAALRPRLHRVWAIGLVLMHLGIWLVMTIPFFENMFLLLLVVFFSPFAPARESLRATVAELPGLAWLLRRRRRASDIREYFDKRPTA